MKNEPRPNSAINLEEAVVDVIKMERPGKLLDIGAYEGSLSLKLKNLGFNVSACDVNPSKFKKKIVGIECDYADLNEKLPYKDSEFDYVCCCEVIEHLKRPFDAIKEIGRILKKNGILILTTPNILDWYSRLKFLKEGVFNHYFTEKEFLTGYHIHPFHFYQLRYFLEQNGFRIEKISSNSYLGKLNFAYPKIFLCSLFACLMRPFMKPDNRVLLEGDILIIKAKKVRG